MSAMKLLTGGDGSPSKEPKTGSGLREAMHRAVTASESRKANQDSCPTCKKRAALLSLVFRGIRVGRLCRFCPFTTFSFHEPKAESK